MFDTPTFKVNPLPDVCGVEICGALKNVIAVAVGFCDAMEHHINTKAAIIRIGVNEIMIFASLFFDGVLAVSSTFCFDEHVF